MRDLFKQQRGRNGILPLSLGLAGAFASIKIAGGPFDHFVPGENQYGVCVRAERVVPRTFNVHVPIEDFCVPDAPIDGALVAAFDAALCGRAVYVGCMGGFGRTGLFLALMAKAAGVPDPVAHVREHYCSHAVETRDQARYVAEYDVTAVRKFVRRKAWSTALPRAWKKLTEE